jgi:hypothetical protein
MKILNYILLLAIATSSTSFALSVGDDFVPSGDIPYQVEIETDNLTINDENQVDGDGVGVPGDLNIMDNAGILVLRGDASDEFVTNEVNLPFLISYNNKTIVDFSQALDGDGTETYFMDHSGGTENDKVWLTLTYDADNHTPSPDEPGGSSGTDGSNAPDFTTGTLTLDDGTGTSEQSLPMILTIQGGQNIYDFEKGSYTEQIFVKAQQDDS